MCVVIHAAARFVGNRCKQRGHALPHRRCPASSLLRTHPPPSTPSATSRVRRLLGPTLLRRFRAGSEEASPVASACPAAHGAVRPHPCTVRNLIGVGQIAPIHFCPSLPHGLRARAGGDLHFRGPHPRSLLISGPIPLHVPQGDGRPIELREIRFPLLSAIHAAELLTLPRQDALSCRNMPTPSLGHTAVREPPRFHGSSSPWPCCSVENGTRLERKRARPGTSS